MSKVETMLAEEEWTEVNERLADATPIEILQWGVERFFPRLTMATAFGPEGCILIHLLAEIEPRVRVFNLDTGYQFPETLALARPDRRAVRDRGRAGPAGHDGGGVRAAARRAALRLRTRTSAATSGRSSRCGVPWSVTTSWITAIRADQSSHRAKAKVVGWDAKFGLVKVNPLLNWTQRDVWAFIVANSVPYNPLHDQGYPSIGCWPCTQPVAAGEDERAGRWAGQAKTECGLHSLDSSQL